MIESAIALPIFLVFIMVSFDFFRLYYEKFSIRHAFWKSVRMCQTSDICTNIADFKEVFNNKLSFAGIQFVENADEITACSISDFNEKKDCKGYSKGEYNELVVFRLKKVIHPIFFRVPCDPFRVTITTIVKNEPI